MVERTFLLIVAVVIGLSSQTEVTYGANPSDSCVLLGAVSSQALSPIGQRSYDPVEFLRNDIDPTKIDFHFPKGSSHLETGEIWYDGGSLGSWVVHHDGNMVTSALRLGDNSPFAHSGLGSLVYLVAAVRNYDRKKVVLHSYGPNSNASRLWRRFVAFGLAEKDPRHWGEYRFTMDALVDTRLDPIRRFLSEHTRVR